MYVEPRPGLGWADWEPKNRGQTIVPNKSPPHKRLGPRGIDAKATAVDAPIPQVLLNEPLLDKPEGHGERLHDHIAPLPQAACVRRGTWWTCSLCPSKML